MTALAVEQIELIDLDKLEVHPSNPRRDQGDLGPLAASIKKVGVIEPIVAVKHNGKMQVVAGSRRMAAARKAGLKGVPVRVMELDEAEATAAALIENIQRKELGPLEEAGAFRGWLTITGKRNKDLAEAVGLDESTISNSLRLLEAPKPVKDAVDSGEITAAHARVALQLKDPSLATKLPLRRGVTVDALKAVVDEQNRASALNGAVAIEAARAFLAAAKTKHPKATFTWEPRKPYGYAQLVVDLVKALGKPPFTAAGPVNEGKAPMYLGLGLAPTQAAHAKVCSCEAYRIVATQDYSAAGEKLVLELQRVCVDKAAYAKTRPKQKKAAKPKHSTAKASSSPKPLTPEQIKKREAAERKKNEQDVARALAAPRPQISKFAPLYKKIATGSIPADIARAYVALETLIFDLTVGDQAESLLWQRIRTMPGKAVSKLAGAIIADHIEGETRYSMGRAEGALDEILTYFGVKTAPRKKPVAKKKAKR
jgi:ParB family transcriptional regulator, chromosome partitioning protein